MPAVNRKSASGCSPPKAASGSTPKSSTLEKAGGRPSTAAIRASRSSVRLNCAASMARQRPSATPSSAATRAAASPATPLGSSETMTSGNSRLGTKGAIIEPPQMWMAAKEPRPTASVSIIPAVRG